MALFLWLGLICVISLVVYLFYILIRGDKA